MATAFKIEKGVPIPPPAGRGNYGSAYPFADMDVGDSFKVPSDAPRRTVVKLTSAAAYHQKRLGRRFSIRKLEDGVRVWRTS